MGKLDTMILLVVVVVLICLREEEERQGLSGARPGGKKQRLRQCVLDGKRGAYLEAIPSLTDAEFRSQFNLSEDEVEEVLDRPGVREALSGLKMSPFEQVLALLTYLKEGVSIDHLSWGCGINKSTLQRSLRRSSKVWNLVVVPCRCQVPSSLQPSPPTPQVAPTP